MRLRRLGITNFRGVSEATVDFADGVTVVEGPNEVGKSSLGEAWRLLRDLYDSSSHRDIKKVQPVGQDVGPQASVELELGGDIIVFEKRWLKSSFTKLTVTGSRSEQLAGREAHDRFNELLTKSVNVELLGALDVAQGSSLTQPVVADIPVVQQALAEQGQAVEDTGSLLSRVDEEFKRYFTLRTGQEAQELREASKQLEKAQADWNQAKQDSVHLDSLTDKHATVGKDLVFYQKQLREAQKIASKNRRAVGEFEGLKERREQAKRDLKYAQSQAENAEARKQDRQRLVEQWQKYAEEAKEVTAEKVEAERKASEASEVLADLKKQLAEKEADLKRVADRVKLFAGAIAASENDGKIKKLESQLRDAEELESSVTRLKGKSEAILVDEDTVDELQKLDMSLRMATKQMEAAAATVTVTALGDQPVGVSGDHLEEATLGENDERQFPVVDELSVEVAGIVKMVVTPANVPEDMNKELAEAQERLDNALALVKAKDVADARQQATQKRDLGLELGRTQARLEQLLGEQEPEEIRLQIAELQEETSMVHEEVETLAHLTSQDRQAGKAAAEKEQAQLEAELQLWEEKISQAKKDAEATGNLAGELRVRAEVQVEQENYYEQQVKQAREKIDDQELEEQWEAATKKLGEAQTRVEELQEEFASADVTTLETHLETAQKSVESLEQRTKGFREELLRLEGALETASSKGLYDKLMAAEASLEAAVANEEAVRRRAEAVKLLREVLQRHRDEAQQRYVQPFKEQIERLGHLVYGPGFQVNLTEDLQVESRTLEGNTIEFSELSTGAKEQLALLSRLAVARLVDEEQGAPLIMDDTFGHSDPDRLQAFQSVLRKVGEEAQIILLTCDPGRFAQLGGATLQKMLPTSG